MEGELRSTIEQVASQDGEIEVVLKGRMNTSSLAVIRFLGSPSRESVHAVAVEAEMGDEKQPLSLEGQ